MAERSWRVNWVAVEGEHPPRGGQGNVKRVRHRTADPGITRFLKVLSRQDDRERRARMYREVSSYRTLSHPGIPRLIETNSEEWENPDYELYLVTEFIEGENLAQLIGRTGALAPGSAVGLTSFLLDILVYCHQRETLHRDIKPDNIIIGAGGQNRPYLVDFGLAFNKDWATDFETESAQDLSNRFFRLLELTGGSTQKHDSRSDVTMCCAILFYSLTGIAPAIPLDAELALPHQRGPARTALNGLTGIKQRLLASIFDRGFQPELDRRWQNAVTLKGSVDNLMGSDAPPEGESIADRIRRMREQAESGPNLRLAELRTTLRQARMQLETVHQSVQHALNENLYSRTISGQSTHFEELTWKVSLGLTELSRNRAFTAPFWIRIIGSEIVFSVNLGAMREVYRTPVSAPDYGPQFQDAISRVFVDGLSNI